MNECVCGHGGVKYAISSPFNDLDIARFPRMNLSGKNAETQTFITKLGQVT